LSQLSRAVEQREDKKPQLSDLRESGSIEQDADIVLFVYREEYYVAAQEPRDPDDPKMEEWRAHMERVFGLAEVVIAKQRHGATGKVKLKFEANITRFSDLAEEGYYADPH
jgi:replicative DNA helicase